MVRKRDRVHYFYDPSLELSDEGLAAYRRNKRDIIRMSKDVRDRMVNIHETSRLGRVARRAGRAVMGRGAVPAVRLVHLGPTTRGLDSPVFGDVPDAGMPGFGGAGWVVRLVADFNRNVAKEPVFHKSGINLHRADINYTYGEHQVRLQPFYLIDPRPKTVKSALQEGVDNQEYRRWRVDEAYDLPQKRLKVYPVTFGLVNLAASEEVLYLLEEAAESLR